MSRYRTVVLKAAMLGVGNVGDVVRYRKAGTFNARPHTRRAEPGTDRYDKIMNAALDKRVRKNNTRWANAVLTDAGILRAREILAVRSYTKY